MKMPISGFIQLGCVGCLALLSSCSTYDAVHPKFPAEGSIIKGAGHGDALIVNVRLENGEELPIVFDTGAPCGLVLDKSLEPKLGKQLAKRPVVWPGGKAVGGIYRAPALYLGDVQLLAGSRVATIDMSHFRIDHPILGLVGLDCLQHY